MLNKVQALPMDVVDNLKAEECIRRNLEAYRSGVIPPEWLEKTLPTGVTLSGEYPELLLDEENDGKNAAVLHGALGNVSRLMGSDQRLWAWLALQVYPAYVSQRWPFLGEEGGSASVSHVANRWYFGRDPRARHGLARLWWAGELTGSPQKLNPVFFADLPACEPYAYTEVLFSRQDYQFHLIENRLSRAPEVLIPVLHFLAERANEGKAVTGKQFLDGIIRELNLTITYRRFEMLSFPEMLDLIRSMFELREKEGWKTMTEG